MTFSNCDHNPSTWLNSLPTCFIPQISFHSLLFLLRKLELVDGKTYGYGGL